MPERVISGMVANFGRTIFRVVFVAAISTGMPVSSAGLTGLASGAGAAAAARAGTTLRTTRDPEGRRLRITRRAIFVDLPHPDN